MKHTIEKLAAIVATAVSRRARHENLWQDCLDLAQPDGEHFYHQREGQESMDDVFDETAIDASEEFVSLMADGATPKDASYFNVEPVIRALEDDEEEGDEPEDITEVKAKYAEINAIVTETISASNFHGQAQQNWEDLAISHCAMVIDEGDLLNPLLCQAVPAPEIYFIPGPYGNIGGIVRKRMIQNKSLLVVYPKFIVTDEMQQEITKSPEVSHEYVEVTYRDWSNKAVEVNYYTIFRTDTKHIGIDETLTGRGANPWIWTRWRPRANEPYGRGPLMKALPAIRLVNLVQQLLIENAEMSISGIWDYQDDGVINADTIELIPGTIIPRGLNTEGLRNVKNNTEVNLSELIIENLRKSIRNALYNEDYGDLDSTPISATEASLRSAKLARRIGPAYDGIWEEYITAFIYRVLFILKKQGKIKMPKIDGREAKLVPRTPIARAMRIQSVNDMDNYVMRLRNTFGDEIALKNIKVTEHIKMTAKLSEYPIDLVDEEADLGIPGAANTGIKDVLEQAGGAEGVAALLGGGELPAQ